MTNSVATNPGLDDEISRDLIHAHENYRLGRLDEGMRACSKVLHRDPDNCAALHLMGLVEMGRGNLAQATTLLQRAVSLNGNSAAYLCNLGTAFRLQNRIEEAEQSYRSALAIDPDYAEANNNLGAVMHDRGSLEEAIACFQRALAVNPDYAEAYNNLGAVWQGRGHWGEAISCYEQALQRKADYAEAYYNLGMCLERVGQRERALSCFEHAVASRPELAEAHCHLGKALRDSNRLSEAASAYERALAARPGDGNALNDLGAVFQRLGRWDEAVSCFDRAIAAFPNFADAYFHRGNALGALSRLSEAVESYQQAISVKPNFVEALNNLGNILLRIKGRTGEAVAAFNRAIAIDPAYAIAHANLGNALSSQGRLADSIASYRRALQLDPNLPIAHSNLIFTQDFLPSATTRERQQERHRWYAEHGKAVANSFSSFRVSRVPGRRLRVGYVSADFRRNAAFFVFGPVLQNHDRSELEVHCYSGVRVEDDVTRNLRSGAQGWCSTVTQTDAELAQQIWNDGIDILVDLSGHSALNRLLVFARKPAPIQVTGWGHLNGTGVETIDYLFSDRVAIPPEERQYFAEEVVDLPCCICYQAPPEAPDVSPLPSLGGRPFTFGCLNRIEKISDSALQLWAQMLLAKPQFRLLIKDRTLDDPETRGLFLQRLYRCGIDEEKVLLLGWTPQIEHLAVYQKVDLALDPFPMGGGVSTAEALWMGVPVVTMLGAALPGRVSASILAALGREDWIANTEQQYARIALGIAEDLSRLDDIRRSLRKHVALSGVGDVRAYTRAVEAFYRKAWKRWCSEQVN